MHPLNGRYEFNRFWLSFTTQDKLLVFLTPVIVLFDSSSSKRHYPLPPKKLIYTFHSTGLLTPYDGLETHHTMHDMYLQAHGYHVEAFSSGQQLESPDSN